MGRFFAFLDKLMDGGDKPDEGKAVGAGQSTSAGQSGSDISSGSDMQSNRFVQSGNSGNERIRNVVNAAEAGYDVLEEEYLSVLTILKTYETDQAAAKTALEEKERHLSRMLEAAGQRAGEIEQRAGDTMSGSDLAVMMKMLPSLMSAGQISDVLDTVKKERGSRLEELGRELETRGKTSGLDGETAEQLRRITMLLEGLAVSDEVTGMLGSIF
ncbi:MAG: hypothetical protein IJR62_04340 [Lachnospiraceae bacterium]|nr:hypothetical protein [Lachnospiraceae bacterium]